MYRYHLSLGSNMGDRRAFLRTAVEGIRRLGRVTAESSVYETVPVGFADQPNFLNMAVELETELVPTELMRHLKEIEAGVGNKATVRHGPRQIDIDILLWSGGGVIWPDLEIPHPRLMERGFMLIPLAEIAPNAVLPTGITVAEAAARVGSEGVQLVPERMWEYEV
jgi:2-amino-4-hydroxy-6-hydroxymethyldihydropteridine diphosphokinase